MSGARVFVYYADKRVSGEEFWYIVFYRILFEFVMIWIKWVGVYFSRLS